MAPARFAAPTTISGKPIGPHGHGMMGMTTRMWDPIPFSESIKTLKAALEHGANFWNAGTAYGTPTCNSLHLLKAYFTAYPTDASRVVLSLKGLWDPINIKPDGTPEGIRAHVNMAYDFLNGVKKIDVFQCARVDSNVPIETSIGALAELVQEGKIGAIGLSEVGAETIRRAHKVHPVAAVEVELSLFTTEPLENGVAETCRELGIPLVAYSPLGWGFLTGNIQKLDDLPADDFRRHLARFQPAVFDENLKLAKAVQDMAVRKGCTTAQVALAWVRAQGAIPIPGATKVDRVVENDTLVDLTDADLEEIQGYVERLPVRGGRYAPGKQEEFLSL